jgi:ATP-dependent DNA helicase RecG
VNHEPFPSAAELAALLADGMGLRLHWFPEDTPLPRLAAVLVGMANTQGGRLLLGIAPRSAHIQGVLDPAAACERLVQAALLAEPLLILPLPEVIAVGETQIVTVQVPAGLPQVYSLEGRFLGREGAQTNPLPARKLRALLLERGLVQFETQMPPAATLDDLDPTAVAAYLAAIGQPDSDPAEALLRRGCLRRVAPQAPLQPTYAALLLFGRAPQQWVPSAVILAVQFGGVSFGDQFVKQELRGSLPEQIRQADLFLRDHVRQVARLEGLTRQERPEFPLEAARELLVNAVAHRDYNQQGDVIHLNLFADRLEVQSPGGLPGPVTLANLLEARFSRNAIIVQVLSDLGFVERLGYGLDRVVSVCRQNGLRAPLFEESGGGFRVTLLGARPSPIPELPDLSRYAKLGLNPRQEQALAFLAQHRRITNRDYQELCPAVHVETLRRDLVDLVRRGVLIKVGDKRATYYIFK